MSGEREYELFITEEESRVLEALVSSDVPYSQRAQALLAIDAGSSVDQAALVSGLRATQVKYWIGVFSNSRLSVFPDALLVDIEEVLRVEELQKSSDKPKKKKKKDKTKKKLKKKDGNKKAKGTQKLKDKKASKPQKAEKKLKKKKKKKSVKKRSDKRK